MRARIAFVSAVALLLGSVRADDDDQAAAYKHIVLFSVDGMHASDVEKYLSVRPSSVLASLLNTGYEYTNAFCPGPSDSFPGTLAPVTGALPGTTGVWYDDIWDRDLWPVGSDCSGPSGAEVALDETIDFDDTLVFSGGINPANLPMGKVKGKCTPIYPHMRPRVNTAWEVLVEKGMETAYTDKHPAYDLVRGPSGTGLTQGYFPEIAALPNNVAAVIGYDQLHVNAFLDWINGGTPANYEGSVLKGIPTMFGGNFQSVSVGQKTKGYQNLPGNPFTPELLQAFDFVDASLGHVVDALTHKGIYDDTLIIIASKHGQTPIDPTKFGEVDPALVTAAAGVDVLFQTSDDIALLFLKSQSDTATAVNNLNAAKAALKINSVISGDDFIAQFGTDPKHDSAAPDIVVTPIPGIVFSTSNKKIAEHGGLSDDDRHVACIVSNPKLKKTVINTRVETKQIAPTILRVLGINPNKLMGVVKEGTNVLPGF